jgi:hypothetical protein
MYYYCRWSYIVIEALSSIEMATDCQGGRGSIDVTRSRHNIALHVSCFSFFLQFSVLFQHLNYHISIHSGSQICWFVLTRGILGRFKENIYVFSGDERKHSSLLHWVMLIEKKVEKTKNQAYSLSNELTRIPWVFKCFEFWRVGIFSTMLKNLQIREILYKSSYKLGIVD